MKKCVVCLVIVLAATTAFADDGSARGGSGGPEIAVTELGGSFAGLAGGSGRATINHTVSIGGGGFGTALPIGGVTTDGGDQLRITYGGFIVGVEVPLLGAIRAGAEVLLGGGSATVGDGSAPTHGFYVVEPEVRVDIALLKWLRISIGAGYRLVLGLEESDGLNKTDLSGLVVPIGVRFGSF